MLDSRCSPPNSASPQSALLSNFTSYSTLSQYPTVLDSLMQIYKNVVSSQSNFTENILQISPRIDPILAADYGTCSLAT
jgi:hypothetical protein